MNRFPSIVLPLVLLTLLGCSKSDLNDYSLGTDTYPNSPDCKQAYFKGKPIPSIFLKKLTKTDGGRLEGIACHGANIVVDVKAGTWKEGKL